MKNDPCNQDCRKCDNSYAATKSQLTYRFPKDKIVPTFSQHSYNPKLMLLSFKLYVFRGSLLVIGRAAICSPGCVYHVASCVLGTRVYK